MEVLIYFLIIHTIAYQSVLEPRINEVRNEFVHVMTQIRIKMMNLSYEHAYEFSIQPNNTKENETAYINSKKSIVFDKTNNDFIHLIHLISKVMNIIFNDYGICDDEIDANENIIPDDSPLVSAIYDYLFSSFYELSSNIYINHLQNLNLTEKLKLKVKAYDYYNDGVNLLDGQTIYFGIFNCFVKIIDQYANDFFLKFYKENK